ncbi:histidine phosphatase family protein [Mycolicibacterium diernhoferi]|uniref:Histidine phosphatase family protein n=1 Tax=Mycolicibacterium diernhoferi TaxID=1801 RepID=A0A1Q4HDU4_9MYCO|nr:histidine phosphatase family protein [Mycolicibacterium diernhoferi]OJZ65655.1 histidine phosphatase family protein [Mycolicibacterium diernhoferi]OPE49893.1 histidine phosphatase family protein [Mycolicibacterium diernhoferi]PEG56028.1 histidine phosphatase family protein [Mycolicibacterium diernhoferi]QYL22396.1 histidine phosphatase family protein [Mycolicibacterium diernhoferi]
MSEVVRLTLVSHGMTDAMAAGRFATDEPLNDLGHRQVGACADLGPFDGAVCGPERRTVQTADLLGLRATTAPALADLNCGRWRGAELDGVDPADLTVWLTDPSQAPHGGESIVALCKRVGSWLDAMAERRGRLVAVTHPAVIRAAVLNALNAPAKSFWRIDIEPAGRVGMHYRGHVWTLRLS